jgi:hypothetical protein
MDIDEYQNKMQIKWENTFIGDKRLCSWCESLLPANEMKDVVEDGFIFKMCKECE